MNRIRKLIPGCRQDICGYLTLLATLLTGPALQCVKAFPPSQHATMLDSHTAAKLLIHVAKPEYPPIAKLNYIQGSVKLEINVSPEGKVVRVHVVEGEPLLAAAAIQAVRQWRYRPYVSSGNPVAFNTFVAVQFALHLRRFRGHLPRDPEGYLEKQVHPPEVLTHPQPASPAANVRLKVLVGPKGKVLDAAPLEGEGAEVELARENLRHWKFRPARWGAIAVPWYVTVQVPLERALVDQAANSAGH